jgi:hypothetical protein
VGVERTGLEVGHPGEDVGPGGVIGLDEQPHVGRRARDVPEVVEVAQDGAVLGDERLRIGLDRVRS